MKVGIYSLIFVIGTLFGSFFTLAIYRIPLKQNILFGRSYCPKCNHKLSFWDLIPILSYIFLNGKCRYCKEKIRPRYLLLELFSGLTFLLFALSLRIDLDDIKITTLIYLLFGMLYLATLFIISGIDKENHNIQKSVLVFGVIVEIIYIIYLYILGFNIYKYVIYMCILLALIILNDILMVKMKKQSYVLQILSLCFYSLIFIKEEIFVLSILMVILIIVIKQIVSLMKYRKDKKLVNYINNLPIGFYLCVCNIIILISQNYII